MIAIAEKTEGSVGTQEDRAKPRMVAVKISRPLDTSIAAQLARAAMVVLAERGFFKSVNSYEKVVEDWNRDCIEAGQLPVLYDRDARVLDVISPPKPADEFEFEQFEDF